MNLIYIILQRKLKNFINIKMIKFVVDWLIYFNI